MFSGIFGDHCCKMMTKNKLISFPLLLGFCKNDKNHDVRLKVEAIRVMDSEVKAGEGFFAIYPRTNAPRINLYADPEEELYQYTGIMALLRVQNDYLAMHCGRLLYSVAFHEARPVVLKEISSSSSHVLQEEKPFDGDAALCSPCESPTLNLGPFQELLSLPGQLDLQVYLQSLSLHYLSQQW